jgi:chromosome segregation ATPase
VTVLADAAVYGPASIITAVFGGLAALYSLLLTRHSGSAMERAGERIGELSARLTEAEHAIEVLTAEREALTAERDSARALNVALQVQLTDVRARVVELETQVRTLGGP